MLALAFVVELVPLPFYARDTIDDWVVQALAGVISAVGLAAAVHSLVANARGADQGDAFSGIAGSGSS